ncbi:Uma2 family endonuclease [Lusitaniella coriacea]|uniref:Uma2 family endonuclease n=1 Tax=Lusitaniella coriacea TaxID=1983105 RepID=UPI003CE9F21E
MQLQIDKRYYTPEEYLALEEEAEYKHEYRDGEIIAIAGKTTNHNKIAGNFCRQFPLTIDSQDYEIYIGDVRLWIPEYRIYTYPDVMVIKEEPIYEGTGKTTITNPLLIVEVLSNSTQGYDRGDKFKAYRSIPIFQEYLLIDQYRFYGEQLAKNTEGKWVLTEYAGEDAVISFASLDFQVAFKDIYRRVNFDLEER